MRSDAAIKRAFGDRFSAISSDKMYAAMTGDSLFSTVAGETAKGASRDVQGLTGIAAQIRQQGAAGALGQAGASAQSNVTINIDNSQKVEAGQWFSATVGEAFPKPAPDGACLGVD